MTLRDPDIRVLAWVMGNEIVHVAGGLKSQRTLCGRPMRGWWCAAERPMMRHEHLCSQCARRVGKVQQYVA